MKNALTTSPVLAEELQTAIAERNQARDNFSHAAQQLKQVKANARRLAKSLRIANQRIEGYDADGIATSGIQFSDEDRDIIKAALVEYDTLAIQRKTFQVVRVFADASNLKQSAINYSKTLNPKERQT